MADRLPQPMRMTRQRRVILDALRRRDDHPTADEVFHAVRRRVPHVSLATVYRNLDLLAREGLIRRLAAEGGKMRFDGRPAAHDHVVCLRCGRMADVPEADLARQEARAGARADYRVVGHRLEYLGYCPGCREGGRVKSTATNRRHR